MIEYKLSDLMQIKYGKDHKHLADGSYPLYGSGGVMRYVEKPLYDDESILIPRKGTLSNLFFLDKPFWSVDTMFYSIINKKLVFPKYLFYTLKTFDLASLNVGSAVPSLTTEVLNEVPITIPDLPTQTAIAEILSSLDDKIELNNKINLELEQLAQTLFKQWFIDFEFPNENGEPYKSSGGEMVESELGEIPKGWEVKNLDEISNITIGRTPPRQEHHWFSENPNDVKWISIKDMGNCGTYISETSEYLTEEAVTKFKIPTIEKNTVIISFKLTVGRISITTERMLSNEAIAHINLINKELSPEFIYLYLKQFDFDSLGSTSSIATAVNSKSIKAIKIYKPSKDVLKLFQLQVEALFHQLFNNTFEKRELTNLRDTLLPKLISGELAVSSL
jgi:type I restriction enzyme S subunit